MSELTDVFLRSLKPPKSGRIELRDSQVKGLVLRLTSNGTATWSVRTRIRNGKDAGKQTRPALGTWPALSIRDARRAALAALASIQTGGDPVAENRQARKERLAINAPEATVKARLDAWQETRSTGNDAQRWSDRYALEVARLVKREVLPTLGKRNLAETTRADWTALIAAKRKKAPGSASMLYRTCAAFLNFAEAQGWIATPMLPRKGLSMLAPMPAPRERVLTDDELTAVWLAADREAPKLRTFVRLLILTAAREGEVAGIMVGEVDRDAARWAVPAHRTKNRNPYTLPLSALALIELATVWPNETPAPSHCLLGRSAHHGFTGFSNLKERLDAASGVTGWRFHDLRRTARTGMTRLGIVRDHAEAAINHISARSQLERTYDRHDYADEIIKALTTWQAHVAGLVGASARILPLAERRHGGK